jgi:3D (Asp-Asp-Asp) domain-containing protein
VAFNSAHGNILLSGRARHMRSLLLTVLLATVFGAAVTAQQTPPEPTFKVNLSVDGETRELISPVKTVGELLKEHHIVLGDMDRCSVPFTTALKDGMNLTVTRVRSEIITERQPIPFKTRETITGGLRVGTRQIVVPGKEGEKATTFRVYYKDGKPTERVKLSQTVTAPKVQVVKVGARGMTLASRGQFNGRRMMELTATAYGPGGNGKWGMTTAMGIRPRYGIVAVDPRIIPLGTRLYVEGYGPALAADTGGAIKGMRIDLFYPTDRQAYNYGRKKVRVLIMN